MAKKLIVSLLPGATEMIVAMGAGDQLVGVSHECDWPASVQALPRVTTTPIDVSRSSLEIDRAVRDAVAAGRAVIGIDASVLRALHPDIIVTQQLCDVCAVADGDATRLAAVMSPAPEVLVLTGSTLAGVWEDIRSIGTAIGCPAQADRLAESLEAIVARSMGDVPSHRPTAIAIEWLEPLFLAGHWVPEMIDAAGGVDVGGTPGTHSVVRDWDEVIALDPEIIFVVLCGFDAARARRELVRLGDQRAVTWLAGRRVVVLDGNAYTSRPGPRLVDGIRLMSAAIRELIGR